MKYHLRVPTSEQYAYIEAEYEGSAEEAVEAYRELTVAVRTGFGLPQAEFNKALDEYLKTNELRNGADLYAQMDAAQQRVFQELKKAFKRMRPE